MDIEVMTTNMPHRRHTTEKTLTQRADMRILK